MLFLFMF